MGLYKAWKWKIWLVLVFGLSGYLGAQLFVNEEKPDFLIGETTHGHFQIEMQCDACHGNGFGGQEVVQEACVSCHADELKESQDSHPKSKFTDPRNAAVLAKVDARYCVACHVEHNEDITHPMGVTLPQDFCFHCHEDIAEDRVSHAGMEFNTCASAGCHNFHDNRALYEDFLVQHANTPWLKQDGKALAVEVAEFLQKTMKLPETLEPLDYPESQESQAALALWSVSGHANSNIGCQECHGESAAWQDKPDTMEACESCHSTQVTQFSKGKHGMRLAMGLSPMTPGMSMAAHDRLSFNAEHANTELSCNSCHNPHSVDRIEASTDACLSCHQDDHSTAYTESPHGITWQQVKQGVLPIEQGVSCASCHMPRTEMEIFGQSTVVVQHNQNDNLRPNEKMIRPVCLNCHSLEFSIDSLADENLIKTNFRGQPAHNIPSITMSLDRLKPQ